MPWVPTVINAGLLGLLWWLIRRDIDGARKAADEARKEAKSVSEKLSTLTAADAERRAQVADLQRQIDNLADSFKSLRTDVDQSIKALVQQVSDAK